MMRVALIGLVLCACGEEPVLVGETLHVSKEFGEDTELVLRAVDTWNEATDGGSAITVQDGGTWAIVPGRLANLGLTSPDSRLVTIDMQEIYRDAERDNWNRDSYVLTVVMHELGHALGIHRHLDRGLMTGDFLFPCVDSTTLDAACAEFECGADVHWVDATGRQCR